MEIHWYTGLITDSVNIFILGRCVITLDNTRFEPIARGGMPWQHTYDTLFPGTHL